MTKERFERLKVSIRQAGRIRRGEREPSRLHEYRAQQSVAASGLGSGTPDTAPGAKGPARPDRTAVVAYLRKHRGRLRREYHVRRIAVIGSFARGEERPDSDIDLLADVEGGTTDIRGFKRRLRTELEHSFGRRVHISSEKYLKSYCREEVLREAVYAWR